MGPLCSLSSLLHDFRFSSSVAICTTATLLGTSIMLFAGLANSSITALFLDLLSVLGGGSLLYVGLSENCSRSPPRC